MLDYRQQLEDALWTILEQDAAFLAAVKVGIRMKQSDAHLSFREHAKKGVGDYPQVKIETRNTPQMAPPPRTYSSGPSFAAVSDYTIEIVQQMALIVIYGPLRQTTSAHVLDEQIERVLFYALPSFGLSYVTNATWTISRTNGNAQQPPQTTFLISFSLMPRLSQLTA